MTHPSSLPLEGFAVLKDTPVACQTREPTRRETGAPEGADEVSRRSGPQFPFSIPDNRKNM